MADGDAALEEVLAKLLPQPLGMLTAARAGGNNRVYRAETAAGIFAVKRYAREADGTCPRLDAEFAALELLGRAGEDAVPKAVASDADAALGVYEWIEGSPPAQVGTAEIDCAAGFAVRLARVSRTDAAGAIRPAREASLSGGDILRQVERRFARLAEIAGDHAPLAELLDKALRPALARAGARARKGYDGLGLDFDADLVPGERVLSPSDFGFHNALRRPGGAITFIDFEYFGWDDPVRLVADFLLHPGMDLELENRARFSRAMVALFGAGGAESPGAERFTSRLDLLYPLVGLRWCAILLNEFLPERWAGRLFAGATRDRETAQAEQLAKARRMIARVGGALEGYAHGK